MDQNYDSPPTLPPVKPKRSLLVRLAFILAATVAILIVLTAGAWLVENARGRAAWHRYLEQVEARGEKLDVASLIPQPVADSNNFASTPLLLSLFPNGKGDDAAGARPRRKTGSDETRALTSPFASPGRGAEEPAMGNWETATAIDLENWRSFLEQHPRFSSSPTAHTNASEAVLEALHQFDPQLTELANAARRPASVFPLRYEDDFNMLLPHLAVLKGAASLTRLRALARLQAGQINEALDDVRLILRFADALKDEPLIISQLVRIAILNVGLQPVWDGLRQNRWNEAQLKALQGSLDQAFVLDGYPRCLRGENAIVNATLDKMRTGRVSSQSLHESFGKQLTFIPAGWLYQNQLSLTRFHRERLTPVIDPRARRAYPELAAAAESDPALSSRTPYNFFVAMLVPAVAKTALKFAKAQASLDLAATACALERFHLTTGSYPEKLADLPAPLTQELHPDLISGEPLRYARTSDGRYQIFSVGWNGADDQGEVAHPRRSTNVDATQGDWVWRYSQ